VTDVPEQPEIERRRLLKGAVVAGGAAMVTPAILSVAARPAAASAPFGTVAQNTATSASSLTLTIAAPTVGVLVAAVAVRRNVLLTFTVPPGWTLLSRDLNNPRINLAVFARTVGVTGPAAYTFSWGISRPAAGWIAHFPGGVGWDPIGARTIPGSATTAMTGASVTPTALSTVCMIGGYNTSATPPTVTAPALYTTRASANAGPSGTDNGAAIYLATRVFSAGAPTGAAVATLSSANRNIGCLLAVH
jgi:hypothetical protein